MKEDRPRPSRRSGEGEQLREVRLASLGDRALLVYLPDEATAVRFAAALEQLQFEWLVDLVPAYNSVGVHFDPDRANLQHVREALQRLTIASTVQAVGRQHVIPCCYEMHLDLNRVAELTALSVEHIITLHTRTTYTVYAIGFCPGFPYLGYLPDELCGVPRLASPRLRLEPGSIGLTGRQTGVYPLVRPGGWNIIGRTPLELVNVADGYFPLRVGDAVHFERIDEADYRRLQGERLKS